MIRVIWRQKGEEWIINRLMIIVKPSFLFFLTAKVQQTAQNCSTTRESSRIHFMIWQNAKKKIHKISWFCRFKHKASKSIMSSIDWKCCFLCLDGRFPIVVAIVFGSISSADEPRVLSLDNDLMLLNSRRNLIWVELFNSEWNLKVISGWCRESVNGISNWFITAEIFHEITLD